MSVSGIFIILAQGMNEQMAVAELNSAPHFQDNGTNKSNNKFQTKMSTQQTHKSNYMHKYHNNKT